MKLLQRKIRIIAFLMSFVTLIVSISGCGSDGKLYAEPELIPSRAVIRMFRKPEKRDIKKVSYAEGIVVPTDYPAFYSKLTRVDKIEVAIGDYVEQGDVIAVGNDEVSDSMIESSEARSSLSTSLSSIQKSISNLQITLESYNRAEAEQTGNADGIKQADMNISLLNEDIRYTDEMASYQSSKEADRRDEIRKDSGSTELVASHSGYVTFVKDISSDDTAKPYENVVVISDMNDLYIECKDLVVKDYKCEDYDEKYTFLDGKKVKVDEIDYLESVKSLSSVQKTPLRMKFRVESGKLNCGDNMLLVFKDKVCENVLTVGAGAVNSEGNNRYVYVRKSGEDIEKRDVQIGYNKGSYIEIKYGLSEDDEVYYSLDQYCPVNYKEIEVGTGNLTVEERTKSILGKNSNTKGYYTEFTGKIEEVYVKLDDKVSRGDLLFTYATDNTRAKLGEVAENIATLKKNHQDTLDMFYKMRKQIEEGDVQPDQPEQPEQHPTIIGTATWTDAKEAPAPERASDTDSKSNNQGDQNQSDTPDPDTLYPDLYPDTQPGGQPEQPEQPAPMYVEERKNLNLAIIDYRIQLENLTFEASLSNLEKQYEKMSKNNDGDGLMSVYAESDGIVKNVNKDAAPGKVLKNRAYVLSVTEEGYNETLIQMRKIKSNEMAYSDGSDANVSGGRSADVGKPIKVKIDDNEITGRSIGINGGERGQYVAMTPEGKPVFTYCTPGKEFGDQFYAELDKKIDYDKALRDKNSVEITFLSKEYKGLPVLDKGVIYTDYVDDKEYNYVWIENNGELEKRYVTILSIDGYKGSDVIIVDGLEIGDKVIRETADTVEDE